MEDGVDTFYLELNNSCMRLRSAVNTEHPVTDMTFQYDNLRDRLMTLGIREADQLALDTLHDEYEQGHATEQQSIERLQDLMFVKIKIMEDALQASAEKASSASNTPQGGQQLAHGQPPSPSEMPPSLPQSPPPAPHAEASEGTNESLANVLGAVINALNKQSSSVAAALPKMARSVHNFSDKKDDRPDRWLKSFGKITGINGWDDTMKVSQMSLHLKDTAEDWYWENQDRLEAGTWKEAEVAFLRSALSAVRCPMPLTCSRCSRNQVRRCALLQHGSTRWQAIFRQTKNLRCCPSEINCCQTTVKGWTLQPQKTWKKQCALPPERRNAWRLTAGSRRHWTRR